ncbi:radical SAM protein [Bradyrhizobium sp. CER78]|uniref:radical SAM/SPASM domain-containing protein n=1 Tax=Bradyrhizobium sp. CER78 TaxID=3039162 RepID=UPI00244B7D67|nr:radical SAM protein [Bradyrhizobium sp. CER78]MDH2380871.1 SPASM domain-containing protein [Bradyrhizobium sp. CER78]
MIAGDTAIDALLARYGLGGLAHIDDSPISDPPMRSLSLAVTQTCNLACGYCYAQGGSFGAPSKRMEWPVARDAVLQLLDQAAPGDRVNIAFLGGEPLINRPLIARTTRFAATEAERRGVGVGFSITTNGTLLGIEDRDLFDEHAFSVTVSLDGIGEAHDRQRPFRDGRGSFERILARITPLLEKPGRMQMSARVTVTPLNLELRRTLDELIGLGFGMVGFSPMLSSPSSKLEMQRGDLKTLLDELVDCGRQCESRISAGGHYPFANLIDALRELHRGTHRPYPCGAGAGYMGVSAEGGLFACHRFVEDDAGRMGTVTDGLDHGRRNAWLADRHVHRQDPCRSCWARYLCGGGCHHEVIYRGRPACDLIRGWLTFCLQAYVRISDRRPDFFAQMGSARWIA